jgi:hypothetical protein
MPRFIQGQTGEYTTTKGVIDNFIINRVNNDRTYDIYFANTIPILVRASSDALDDDTSAATVKARNKLEQDYQKALKLSKKFDEQENKRYDKIQKKQKDYSKKIKDESDNAEVLLKTQIYDFLSAFKKVGRKSRKKRRKNQRKTRKSMRKKSRKKSRKIRRKTKSRK